jgi:hypothetical protein
VVEEDGMSFARVGPPHDDEVSVLNFAIGTRPAASTEDRRQTGDAWGVSSAVTAVDIVASNDRSYELLGKKVQLVGGLGAAEHAEGLRPVPLD